jgi:hypothetical protein
MNADFLTAEAFGEGGISGLGIFDPQIAQMNADSSEVGKGGDRPPDCPLGESALSAIAPYRRSEPDAVRTTASTFLKTPRNRTAQFLSGLWKSNAKSIINSA